ncbi:MAG: hypothetical protein GX567_07555 [Clostridia bacterium]|nr:hypothetical protein [Clostridia bacterium]
MKYPIFLCFVIISIFTYIAAKKKYDDGMASFWEKEQQANKTRKKPLDSLDYISIPIDKLPIDKNTTDQYLLEYQELINDLSVQKIVNLTGITNTDLKLQYGAANLNTLMEYDQNFTLLARTLSKWGEYYFTKEQYDKAKNILEYAVTIRSDVKGTYCMLAEIYCKEFHPEKIDDLLSVVETLNTIMKNAIILDLNKIKNT